MWGQRCACGGGRGEGGEGQAGEVGEGEGADEVARAGGGGVGFDEDLVAEAAAFGFFAAEKCCGWEVGGDGGGGRVVEAVIEGGRGGEVEAGGSG